MDLDQPYFNAALTWETERELMRERSESRAWWVAGSATVIALAAVIGLVLLAPYRRNIPYLLALDRAHGNAEFIGVADERTIKSNQEILDKYWIQHYLVARESYYYRLLQADYDTVLALSDDDVGRDYARQYEGPNSRDKRYGDRVDIKPTVISIQVSTNAVGQQATIRFSTVMRHVDTNLAEPPQYAVASISYAYKPAMFGKEVDLIKNPLGYKTTAYRVDSELAPIEAGSGKPATSSAGE